MRVDAVIPALHGKNGEDGTVQGLLQLSGIPYVGCAALASAVCMDKAVSHTLLSAAGIGQAKYLWFYASDYAEQAAQVRERIASELGGYPVFVKPANAGSSVGVSRVDRGDDLDAAVAKAAHEDWRVVIEECITGREVECAVLGNETPEAALVGEIGASAAFYDYDDKYINGTSQLFIPARLSEEVMEEIRRTACRAYRLLGCEGLARVDFFVRNETEVILNELNTLPGFTSISMYPKLWEACGVSCPELLDRYLAYGALWPELSPEDVVTRVNIGLDGTFYGDVSQAEEPESLSVLVNKYHPLPDGYVPRLHSLPARYAPSGGSLAPAAAAAFMRMADAAREDGITLYSVSAYRSYSYQDSLYRRYTAQDGVEADTYSARPGFSEHQTGLALDINTASRSAHFETTATYRWLIENCWRYGFILRYPEGREDITGFCFEPWHYRFVGRTLALQVRESGLTYDEFLARRAVDRPHTALCAGDMPLEAVPILLDGICWLPAQAVAAAFGRTAAISGDQLVLPAEEGSVVLTAGSLTGERDDRPFALSSLPFQWEGEFYLSLEDLCALLELTARREEGLISLIPRSAPSALLPEELPPIQPLPC